MRSDHLYRHLLIGFGLALAVYIGAYSCDQSIRTRKGPWRVEFGETGAGEPRVTVNQPFLGITNVQIVFEGESVTNGTGIVLFDKPLKPLPFGKTKFEDLTYLPGSVTFDFFGHEVELLPRVLHLNQQEVPWESGAVHRLTPEEKLPPEALVNPRKKKRRRLRQTPTGSAASEAR